MKRTLVVALLFLIALAWLTSVPVARASDQVVTDAGDTGGANQLRAKLAAAQSSGGGTITFTTGVATIVLVGGVLPPITTNTIVEGGNVITVSGNNASSVFSVNPGATLTLTNITITKGYSAGGDGGAIFNNGTLNINSSRFIENQTASGWSGGAIVSYGPLNITNSEFGSNKGGNGGAIYPRFSAAVTTITGSNFHDNATLNTTNGLGGAMLLWDGAPVTITNSTLSGNTARYGGAIYVWPNSSLNITGSQINSNTVIIFAGGRGGAIYSEGTLSLTNVTLSGNSSGGGGGGIYNASATATLTNVTLSGNSAFAGGGIYNFQSTATLTNVTLSGNSTAGDGGGIYHSSNIPDRTITLKNTLIAKGISGTNSNVALGGTFNLSDDNSCGFGPGRDNVNLLLGPLANNGGLTQTHLPQAGSPAIDNATGSGAPPRDQRGYLRAGSAPDVGAAEFGGTIPVTLGNISTRAFVQTGDNVMIGGFIITGGGQKKVIVRAIGPSLVNHGITNPLQDPTLELHDGTGTLITSNDNWMDAPNKQAIIDSGLAPSDNLESAILTSLNPGAYTAIVRGVNNGIGIALVEGFDLDRTAGSKLGNISTRAFVQTGDNVMIGGLIITGPDSDRVIVRAIGPSLAQYGISDPLADPFLELHDANGVLITFNDNWRMTQEAEIVATGLAPSNDLESAIVRTLTPGNYTAIVRGVNNGTGVALVEVYGLN